MSAAPVDLIERRCRFCDVGIEYQSAKEEALAAGDAPAAAEADALAALAEDAAAVAHGRQDFEPHFGTGRS